MALQDADLFVVQQGATVKSIDYAALAEAINARIGDNPGVLPIATASALGAITVGDNLKIDPNSGKLDAIMPDAIDFVGNINPTEAAPSAVKGQAWIVNPTGGVFDDSFQNIAGETGDVGDLVIYQGDDGDEWDLIQGLFGAGVLSVQGQKPIVINDADPKNPVITITEVNQSLPGAMSAADKVKLDAIADGADVGTVTKVTGDAPIDVTSQDSTPNITIATATISAVGVVRLADATAITNGTADRVVDAAQLKVVQDAVTTLEGEVAGLEPLTVLGDLPIEVSPLSDGKQTVSIRDADTAVNGAVRFATQNEADAETSGSLALSPLTAAGVYLNKDFRKLTPVA